MKKYTKEQEERKVQARNKSDDEAKKGRRVQAMLKKWSNGMEDDLEDL